jgi:hypothetical protein
MKSRTSFLQRTLAILFFCGMFLAVSGNSTAAVPDKHKDHCKDRCEERYDHRKHECKRYHGHAQDRCEREAKDERDSCKQRCR